MDEYTSLLNEIKEYLTLPDVVQTEDIVSAYDLFSIVSDKLEELHSLPEIIKEGVNAKVTPFKVFSSKFSNHQKYTSKKCKMVTFHGNEQKSDIIFYFGYSNDTFDDIRLKKDHDSDDIYFGSHIVDRDFVMQNYNLIMNTFSKIEEFSRIFGKVNGFKSYSQEFTDSFLIISFLCFDDGECNIELSINSIYDPNDIYHRTWLNHQSLANFVNENKDTILKKIPINILEISGVCKTIFDEHELTKNESPKVKKLDWKK